MRKYTIILVMGIGFLLSGCSLSHYYGGKTPIELEQYENPMIWKEVLQIQVTLWPLEKKVNKIEKNMNEMEKRQAELEKNLSEMRDQLATTKLLSIQALKNIESLQAEIQQIKSESIRKEKTSVELPIAAKNKKEIIRIEPAKAAGERKTAAPDIPSFIINDIQYFKLSETQDRVLISLNAMNNPKIQTLRGENPRLVLDFLNTRNIDKEKYEINTEGNFIKRIRIRSYKDPIQKVRIVFDMMPDKKYSVDQQFSKKENVYSFHINADAAALKNAGPVK